MADEVRLGDVLETVGEETLPVWAGAAGLDVRLGDVVVHDPADGMTAGPGDLVLAVGATPDAAVELIREAGARGAAAVVVRDHLDGRATLIDEANEAGVALLALAPEAGWARIIGWLRGALATLGGTTADDPGFHQGDLVSFANTLADAVGGSVVVFNPQQEVIAASRLGEDDDEVRREAVLHQEGPAWLRARLRRRGFYRRLWDGDTVVEVDPVPDLGMRRRLAVAIRGGDEILGSIWLAEGRRPLPADAAATLRRAARAAGLHLMRMRGLTRTSRAPAEGHVRRLLAGEADPVMVAGRLGVDPHAPCAMLSCAFAEEPSGREYRLAELLALHLAAYRSTAVPVPSPGRVDVLMCGFAGESGLTRVARDMTARAAQTLDAPLLTAAGPVVPGLGSARRSLDEADLVLRVLRLRGVTESSVASGDDVRASVGLVRLADLLSDRPELRTGPLYALLEHDRRHGTAYGPSLAAYLDAFGDVVAAARRLGVHANTLRYRLRRSGELSGLDLTDPDTRLMTAIQLRVESVCSPGQFGRSESVGPDDRIGGRAARESVP